MTYGTKSLMVMCAAAGDTALADAFETLVRDAVDDAVATIGGGADAALAGSVAGRRFRDALDSHATTDAAVTARKPPVGVTAATRTTVMTCEKRADAFRRMAGIRR